MGLNRLQDAVQCRERDSCTTGTQQPILRFQATLNVCMHANTTGELTAEIKEKFRKSVQDQGPVTAADENSRTCCQCSCHVFRLLIEIMAFSDQSFIISLFGKAKKPPTDLSHTLSSSPLRGPTYTSDEHPAHLVRLVLHGEKDQEGFKKIQ